MISFRNDISEDAEMKCEDCNCECEDCTCQETNGCADCSCNHSENKE